MFPYLVCHYSMHNKQIPFYRKCFISFNFLMRSASGCTEVRRRRGHVVFLCTPTVVITTGGSRRMASPGDTGHCPGPTSQTRSAGPRAPCCPSPPRGSWRSWPPDWGPRPRSQSAASGRHWGPGTDHWCTHCRYLEYRIKHQSSFENSIKHGYFPRGLTLSSSIRSSAHMDCFFFLFVKNCRE